MTFKFKNLLCIVGLATIAFFSACEDEPESTKQARDYSSVVVTKWLGVHSSMLFVQTGNPFGFNPTRYMAYCGVAAYESVVPGMSDYQTLQGQLTGMPEMPTVQPGEKYHWPACANAALASMTKKMFGTVAAAYKEAEVLSLEEELNAEFRTETDDATFQRSVEFGQEIANRIFEWSKSDNANWPTSYTIPVGDGKWKSETAAPPANPYWGYNRLMVPGSIDNVSSPPLAYSKDPSSAYYTNMKEVYDISKTLTHDQKLIAKYYNDSNPGYPAGGHYTPLLKRVLEQLNPSLDEAVFTYAKVGITMFDASTSSFKAKYEHWAERPFSYIRTVIAPNETPEWKPFLTTPGFPDFPSNHAIFSSSLAYVLSSIYGNEIEFTNANYEGVMADLGNGPENLGTRRYQSFEDMMKEISNSRLYGGIHYRYSCEEGIKQGTKVAQNIENKVRFRK